MAYSICLNCGEEKKFPTQKCRYCHFKPKLKNELVQSMWLSCDRRLSEKDLENDIGPSKAELESYAKKIKNKERIQFPIDEIKILENQLKSISEVNVLGIILFAGAFLLIPIIALIVFIADCSK